MKEKRPLHLRLVYYLPSLLILAILLFVYFAYVICYICSSFLYLSFVAGDSMQMV